MSESEQLRKEAEKCRRLAETQTNEKLKAELLHFASEYDEEARLAELMESRSKPST